jgi:hypothetical protein
VDRLALAGQVPINDCSVTVAGNHGEGIVEKELRGSGRRVVGNRSMTERYLFKKN